MTLTSGSSHQRSLRRSIKELKVSNRKENDYMSNGTCLHSIATSRDFTSVSFSESPEQTVGEGKFTEAGQGLRVDLKSRDVGWKKQSAAEKLLYHRHESLTRLGNSLDGIGVDRSGLIALGVEELVVHNMDTGVVCGQQGNLIRNGLSIGERRNVLADVGEAQNDGLGVGPAELGLGLLSENHDVGVRSALQQSAGSLAQTRMDTTAETLVGAGNDEKSLLVLDGLRLSLLEDRVRGLTVGTRIGHGLLGASETCRGNDFHGVGDLLNVLNGLETTLNLTQSREVGGIGRCGTLKGQQLAPGMPPQGSSSVFFTIHGDFRWCAAMVGHPRKRLELTGST